MLTGVPLVSVYETEPASPLSAVLCIVISDGSKESTLTGSSKVKMMVSAVMLIV